MLIKENPVRASRVRLAGQPVSEICFGTEHINRSLPEFGAGILEAAARRHGVTFWDTDNAYGSQTQVAAALQRFDRAEIAVASKTYGRSREEAEYDLTRTLRELNTPYLDFFLLHEVAAGSLHEKMDAFTYMLEMQKQGKVRVVGLSTHCAPVIAAAAEIPEIQVVCAPFNREGSRIEQGSLLDMENALCKAHAKGKGVYVIKVLGKGELTYDIRGALAWALERREFLDVYNLGVANLSELRENVSIFNELLDGEEEGA
ncbi:MAG: aldo/keto reductase [Candidatus Spyradocola sp.]|jgi:aryl-alcohol dehydrogenase-like predicted oxidoreductase